MLFMKPCMTSSQMWYIHSLCMRAYRGVSRVGLHGRIHLNALAMVWHGEKKMGAIVVRTDITIKSAARINASYGALSVWGSVLGLGVRGYEAEDLPLTNYTRVLFRTSPSPKVFSRPR